MRNQIFTHVSHAPSFTFAQASVLSNATNRQMIKKQAGKEDTGHLRICAVKLKKKSSYYIQVHY